MKRFMVVSTLLLAISGAAVPSALAASRFGWGGRPVDPGQAGSRAGVEADQADRSILGEPRAATTDGIVGTWLLNIVEGAGYRFKALVTFGADGTVVGASQGDVCCGLNFTAQHGAWKLNGNKILAVAMFLVYDADTGNLVGSSRLRIPVQLTSTGWSARYTVQNFNPAGQVIFTDSGQISARRIVAAP